MIDSTISATTAVAYVLWIAGSALVGLSFVGPLQLAAVGLLIACMGGVVQIRGFLRCIERREINAFELGRDSVRSLR